MDATFESHPTALVEPGACIGSGTQLWQHVHVRSGAIIGSSCNLGKNVYVDEGVRIGNRCVIQNNVAVYKGVELDDEVFVGPAAVFTNDRYPRARPLVAWELVPTRVRTGAAIGANATIVCGIEIAEWSTIAAGSVLTRSTAPYELMVGNPARRAGWTCRCGIVLSHDDELPERIECARCGFVID